MIQAAKYFFGKLLQFVTPYLEGCGLKAKTKSLTFKTKKIVINQMKFLMNVIFNENIEDYLDFYSHEFVAILQIL